MVSRVLLGRHHILDVLGGVVVGVIEYLLMTMTWMDKESAVRWSKYLGAEDQAFLECTFLVYIISYIFYILQNHKSARCRCFLWLLA